MEIYTLEISFPYDDDDILWVRVIEVSEEFTLRKLHNLIQKIIDFDNDHMYEFFVGRHPRHKAYKLPKQQKLNEIYPITGFKLYYLFDLGDCWLFEIRKSRKKKYVDTRSKLPSVVESTGANPEQYPEYED